MIAGERSPWLQLAVRVAAPMSWRGEGRIAEKLAGFAATEAGSALDMLKAAELESDPRLRRLFFLHALDEARHAEWFWEASRRHSAGREVSLSPYARMHAVRQNLYQTMGRVRFVAFVARAEKKGQQHFAALLRHFEDEPSLAALFARVEREERFHVRYAEGTLVRWSREGLADEVKKARFCVRALDAWRSWRRTGRRIGDVLARGVLTLCWLSVIPFFAVVQRVLEPSRAGWRSRARRPLALDDLKRQM